MADSDAQIKAICSMLGSAFDKSVVEKCYFGNNCNSDLTVDFLLNLSEYELAEIKRNINDRKISVSANKFGMLNDEEDEDISDLLPPKPPMTIRPAVYESLLNTFVQQLPEADIRKIYLKIVNEMEDLEDIEDEILLDTAVEQILQHIEKIEKDNPLDPPARNFETFEKMFSDIIPAKKLKKIWSKLSKSHSDLNEEDIMDFAVLEALEYLDEQDEREKEERVKHDAEIAASLASEDEQGYVVVDEKISEGEDGFEIVSREEIAFDFVLKQMPPDTNQLDIHAALAHFNYDPYDTICYLTMKANGEIDGLDLIASPPVASNEKRQKTEPPTAIKKGSAGSSTSSSSSSDSYRAGEVTIFPRVKDPHYASLLNVKSRGAGVRDFFLENLLRNNVGLKARINSSTNRIEFLGFDLSKLPSTRKNNKNFDKFQASNAAIDLHGLSTPYAVQTVHSVLEYYINAEKWDKTCDQNVVLSNNLICLKFIVGKGKHSANGKSKLRPAVEKYLINEREGQVDFVPFDGVILVSIKK